jgi:hypothetical protein
MLNFKRCATAVALTMAAVPAVAQDMPMPETVLINVEGTSTFYRVPLEIAAGLCEVTEDTLAMIAEDANVIYCTIGEAVVAENDFSGFESFEDDDGSDGLGPDLDLDDDGINDAEDDDLDGDGILNGEDDDLDGDDVLDSEDDDVFEIGDDTETDTDTGTETGTDTDTGAEVDADVEADVDAEVDTDASTGG